ncbi:MAG: hypothetical protein A2173_02180 [Planctomycetes bacterium RBG_13_44_8b]|nr:MAG: hypothetical protein A2173_02180 [Planctomycetes bacterium RBG_13_44_8b]
MASIVVLLIILGCAVFQFFKGSIVKALAAIIIALFASIVAFGFFEILADVLIKRGNSGSMISLVPWAQALSFLLLFVLAFAIVQTATVQLTRQKVDLGLLPERIGRPILGIILGLIASGNLMTFLALAPLPGKYPYERFDPRRIQADNPKKVLLNADGFAAGLFGMVSNGSFSGKRSFTSLHPNYLDQLFLNRIESEVSIVSGSSPAIEVPQDKAVWPASEALKTQIEELNSQGKLARVPGKPKSSDRLMIVRVGIRRSAVKTEAKINAGVFTLSQLRLICTRMGSDSDPVAGKGQNAYPIGYLRTANEIEANYKINLRRDDFTDNTGTKNIDFVFAVPNGFVPALVEFKLNNIVQIPTNAILTDASQAPSPAVFSQSSENEGENQKPSGTQQDSSAGQRRGRPRPQEPNNNPPEQGRVENLTESLTGVQLDDN